MGKTAWETLLELSEMAGTRVPKTVDSPGAKFLFEVAEADLDAGDEDRISEVADGCVPIYTYDTWETFVDLAGWELEVPDWITETEDMTRMANAVLYSIAESMLQKRWQEMEEDDD